MKKILLCFFFFLVTINSKAQTVGQLFTTTRYTSQEFWWSEPFTDSSKFSIFSFSHLRIDHKDQQQNEYLSYSTVNYDIGKGFGISAGGFLTKQGFSPVVALSYFYANDTWLINLFPSIEIKQKPNADFFAFVQYRPKLNDKLRFFNQLIVNSNFNFRQHNFSEQNLRVGLDYKTFQFGIGVDSQQITELMTQKTNSFGIFIRKEF